MKKIRYLIMGIIIGVIISGIVHIFAEDIMISVEKLPLKYFIDGTEVKPNEGEEGFIYNDRTYVPLRFIAEKLHKKVDWNEDGYKISIDEKSRVKNNVYLDELTEYDKMMEEYHALSAEYIGTYNNWYIIYMFNDDENEAGTICAYNFQNNSYRTVKDKYYSRYFIDGYSYIKVLDNYLALYDVVGGKPITEIYNLDDFSKCFEADEGYNVFTTVENNENEYLYYYNPSDVNTTFYRFNTKDKTVDEAFSFK